jgi:hypothetical protein
MIELRCWGCGWVGRVRESYAGLRVTCKRCCAGTTVPAAVTREIESAHWLAAIDPTTEAVTVEVDIPAAPAAF